MVIDLTTSRLLTLLGDPLVSCDLRRDEMDTDDMRAIEAIMVGLLDLY